MHPKSQFRSQQRRAIHFLTLLAILVLTQCLPTAAQAEMAFQALYKFYPAGSNNFRPFCFLTEKDGSFFGTCNGGHDFGTAFRFTPGSGTTVFSRFDGSTGYQPYGGLTVGNDGLLYGVTEGDSQFHTVSSMGTMYTVTTNGGLNTLAYFGTTNGAQPDCNLVLGSDGNLYGATEFTIFKATTNGSITTLATLSPAIGVVPILCGLVEGSPGSFYGTTEYGGPMNYGTIFKVTSSGEYTTLVNFYGTNGVYPVGLTFGNDGNLYGTTSGGGQYNAGTVYRLAPDGTFATVASLDRTNGYLPSLLIEGNDGQFYGSACYRVIGSTMYPGVIYSVTTNGVIRTVATMNGTNGLHPIAMMIKGSDGNLYGTLSDANWEPTGDGSYGCIFRLVPKPTIQSQVVQPGGQTITLICSSFVNGKYQVEAAPSLTSSNWTPASAPTSASGATTSFDVPLGPESQGYFRVVLLPP
jgi:uncharacterized repeat protein (TIGR03803 family)